MFTLTGIRILILLDGCIRQLLFALAVCFQLLQNAEEEHNTQRELLVLQQAAIIVKPQVIKTIFTSKGNSKELSNTNFEAKSAAVAQSNQTVAHPWNFILNALFQPNDPATSSFMLDSKTRDF